MADANTATGTGTTEDIQNGENENSENKLVEEGATTMEVDDVDGAVEEPKTTEIKVEDPKTTEIKVEGQEATEDAGQTESTPGEAPVDGDAETQVKTEVGETTGEVAEEVTGAKEEVIEEVQVKVEGEKDGGDVDNYMVLEEADGGDNESNASDDEELSEVEQLRKANFLLSERLALLEEFIEIEFSEKFGKFVNKRERLVNVVGLGQKYDGTAKVSGKRSAKSLELAGLLKIVNDQAKSNGGLNRSRRFNRNGPSSSTSTSAAKEKEAKTATKDETSTTAGSTALRCHRCKSTEHLVRNCPLPHDPHDRRVLLKRGRGTERRREARREKKQRDRAEAEKYPAIKKLKDKRRQISRQVTRERQKVINPWASGL